MQDLENQPNRRILIIDDNKNIHDDYRKVFNQKMTPSVQNEAMNAFFGESNQPTDETPQHQIQIDSAIQGHQGVELLRKAIENGQPYSLAFVDIQMPPGWDGLKTASELWKLSPDLQIVICSACADHTFEQICQQLGRSDNLLLLKKPFDSIQVYQIAIAMMEKWALSQQAKLKQHDLEKLVDERTSELKQASLLDPLTSIGNRTMFNTMLENALKRTERNQSITGLILIDVDHFKEINDTYGHPAGDQLLIEVARRLQESTRDTDTVARLGGDEFAVIYTDGKIQDDGHVVLDRIETSLGAPFEIPGRSINCGFSIGVAVAPGDAQDPEELVKLADIALYRSKRNGRGRSSYYHQKLDEERANSKKIAADLSKCVQNEELQLYFQPIYSCFNGRPVTLEALIRWNHPDQGTLGPNKFLPMAEQNGLIVEIGNWVVCEACKIAVHWPNDIKVAVNISPTQFKHNVNLCETIEGILAQSGLPPKRLELEITEQVLLQDIDKAAEIIEQLREHGVSVVLDDFGVGHSSLNYLQELPFDKIKLDRSFVLKSTNSQKSNAILKAVASLGKELGIATTAEGIENQHQLDHVVNAGFQEAQGFLFAKPSPTPKVDPAEIGNTIPNIPWPGVSENTTELT